MARPPYEIITNSYGRRVLQVNSYFKLRTDPGVTVDNFDIVYFETSQLSYNDMRHLLSAYSPIRSLKYQLKPKYMTVARSKKDEKLLWLLDGFSTGPLDPAMTAHAEKVLRKIEEFGIPNMEHGCNTPEDFFIRLCQVNLSRGKYDFVASSLPTLRQPGLSAAYAGRIDMHDTAALGENPNDRELRSFVDYMEKKGYVKALHFVERIHLCPQCQDEYLLFTETCSKCGSSNIDHEDMIHHFRCANISPESEYSFDGEMRCPKCHRFLNHIGIDYDRPAKVSVCRECGLTQLSTVMMAHCMECGAKNAPGELTPYDIKQYTFTPAGIEYITHYRL